MAGVPAPSCEEWEEINRMVPRIVDVLPNGPVNYTTVQLFFSWWSAEVMLHLRMRIPKTGRVDGYWKNSVKPGGLGKV